MISIYRNLAEDYLNINLPQGNTINTLTIYNSYGKEFGRYQINSNDYRLNLKTSAPEYISSDFQATDRQFPNR